MINERPSNPGHKGSLGLVRRLGHDVLGGGLTDEDVREQELYDGVDEEDLSRLQNEVLWGKRVVE